MGWTELWVTGLGFERYWRTLTLGDLPQKHQGEKDVFVKAHGLANAKVRLVSKFVTRHLGQPGQSYSRCTVNPAGRAKSKDSTILARDA